MPTVYFGGKDETILEILKEIRNKGDIVVLAPVQAVSVHAPSGSGKRKKGHRFKLEVEIPEDSIIGPQALIDAGVLTIIGIPERRVAPHLRSENEEV